MHRTTGKTYLNPISLASLCSYELDGNIITIRWFGFLTIRTIRLANVNYLRLATQNELPPLYRLFNWQQFIPHRHLVRPVYILQTTPHQRIFLKLDSSAHFKLRQAIAREHRDRQSMAA